MPDRYRVKEMVLTLQGEGALTGTAVVLLRFEGCNLSCSFCDTDYTGTDGDGGGVFDSPSELAEAVAALWRSTSRVNVLCTGGEPLLQLDRKLTDEFNNRGFKILLETNGTIPLPGSINWVCVSPKGERAPVLNSGDEIKIVWPQDGVDPGIFENNDFRHFWIQPVYDADYEQNLRNSIDYCLSHPKWRLSIQTHRYTGIP